MKFFRPHEIGTLTVLATLFFCISIGNAAQPPSGSQPPPAVQPSAPSQDKPSVSLSPTQIDFGFCVIGMKSDAKAVTLTNDGKKAITVNKVLINGDFTESNSCNKPLDPGKSCIISIKFAPTENDKRDGVLVLNYKVPNGDAITSSTQVELRGRGSVSYLYALWPALVIVSIYLLGLIWVRWNLVAHPASAHLKAHINEAITEATILSTVATSVPNPQSIEEVKKLLEKAQKFIGDSGKKCSAVWDWLFWSRGGELAGWNDLHAAKVQLTFFLPVERVRAALECAEAELRQVATPTAVGLADKIREALKTDAQQSLERWRALLAEARSFTYERDDIDYTILSVWHNKAMWLVLCGLLLIVCLAAVINNGVLFLVGATGGLLSRLTRSLYRPDVPTDYGAYWTSLFLSPVIGALTGWGGILLIMLLVDLKILGAAITVDWNSPYSTIALGLALALGFSERFFTSIQTSLEEKLVAPSGSTKPVTASQLRIDTNELPAGTVNVQYSEMTLAASGGKPPYTWALSSGFSLPSGLTLESDGKISGSPQVAGQFTISLRATDAEKKTVSKELTIVVNASSSPTKTIGAPLLSVDTKELPAGTVNVKYPETTLAASGGKPPYTWELISGTLPEGLRLDSSGKIIGTPTAKTSVPAKFTLQAKDAASSTKSREYTINVA